MNEQKKTILWLVSWYPNKWDPFDGDFIQRHARTAAVHHRIHVLFVKSDERQNRIERTLDTSGNLTEQIIYLPKQSGLAGKLLNYLRWNALYKKEVSVFIRQHSPSLIHVHVPWKVGLIARWAKKKYNVPYIITEHWGIYNNVVEDNIHTWPFWSRQLLKNIYRHAELLVSPSQYLAEGVNQLIRKNYIILVNVVDESLFRSGGQKQPLFTFLHVSNMVPLKNVEGLLKAFKQARDGGLETQLLLVGGNNKKYVAMADDLQLGSSIRFLGEVSYAHVAQAMQQSHVLIVNSNIENSPCVIGEALCCGLPVIATEVGGIPELVNEENGLLMPPGDDWELSDCMRKIAMDYALYPIDQIELEAKQRFSIHSLANQFKTLYQRVCSSTNG